MIKQNTLARYLEPLLRGDRKACRAVIEETLQSGIPANSVYVHLVWPVMVEIEKLLREDRITPVRNRETASRRQNHPRSGAFGHARQSDHCGPAPEQIASQTRQEQEGGRLLCAG
ncbi:MAG: B12-binding domain-containing protein [Planctomycetota bacterium]